MACAQNLKALIVFELMDGNVDGFLITVQNFGQFDVVEAL
jgi:hypothetical protein